MRQSIMAIVMAVFLNACGGSSQDEPEDDIVNSNVLRVPVVVHVLYEEDDPETNISDEKIHSQIAVLNEDFRAKNPDIVNVPSEFKEFVADTEIEFYLATTDPDNQLTTGITRTLFQGDRDIFFSNGGGHDAWDSERYLNMWVYDNRDRNGVVNNPGSGQFPGHDPLTDGVVISYLAFGTVEPLHDGFERGRTAVHEIGHWLNLYHIYGRSGEDDGTCDGGDLVDDTPNSKSAYGGNPTHPSASCGSNDMFMNFMDYSRDESLIMFTKGQKKRMRDTLSATGGRAALFNYISQK
jgi:hypothetical protein